MNPEDRLEELNKTMAELQAELAKAKADVAVVKAKRVRNPQTDPSMDSGRNLQGNRGADGSLLTEKQYGIEVDGKERDYGFTGDTVSDEAMARLREKEGITEVPKEGKEIFTQKDLFDYNQVMIKQVGEDWMQDPRFKEAADFYLQAKKDAGQEGELEYDAIQEFDEEGNPIPMFADEGTYGIDDPTHIMPDGSEMYDSDMDMTEKDVRKDSESAQMRAGSTGKQDRSTPMAKTSNNKTDGMTQDEGGTSTVNEKDDFWKTEEGYNKAVEMYGKAPSWVKEPTMAYNPTTGKYEKIPKEDKEQFEDLGISSDIKNLFG